MSDELVWDPPSIDRNARQLVGGLVDMLNSVERPLRATALPEMPPGVRGQVSQAISGAVTVMSNARVMISSVAQDLRRRAGHISTIDSMPELPWWVRAGDWLGSTPGTAKDSFVWVGNQIHPNVGHYVGGFADGTGELFTSVGTLGRVGLEGMADQMVPGASEFWCDALGIETATSQFQRGIEHMVRHPGQAFQAVIGWDKLSNGKWRTSAAWSEWAGYMSPGVIADVLTGGTAAVLPATRATAAATRAQRAAMRADRAALDALGHRVNTVQTHQSVRRQMAEDLEAAERRLADASRAATSPSSHQRPGSFESHAARARQSAAQRDVTRLREALRQLDRVDHSGSLRDYDVAAAHAAATRLEAQQALQNAYQQAAISTGQQTLMNTPQMGAEERRHDH